MSFYKATVSIIHPNNKAVTYYDLDGSVEIRISTFKQGAAWRNNNPGNLIKCPTTKSLGAIGDDGKFAIFPDMETGRKAKEYVLQTKYIDYKSIRQMLKGKFNEKGKYIAGSGWAPKNDGNNPDQYADQIKKWTGLDVDNKKLADLTPEEWTKLKDAMKRKEGINVGQIIRKDPHGKIITPIVTQPPTAKKEKSKPTPDSAPTPILKTSGKTSFLWDEMDVPDPYQRFQNPSQQPGPYNRVQNEKACGLDYRTSERLVEQSKESG